MNTFLILVYVMVMAIGQLLFKQTSASAKAAGGNFILFLLTSGQFYLAISIYGLLTFYWVWLLGRVPLSFAYPFVALSIALVAGFGMVVWGERITALQTCGLVLILCGVVMYGLGQGAQ